MLDLLQGLRGQDSRKLRVPLDGHPNAEGHRLLGEGIAKHVLAMLEGKEATGAASSGK